MTAAIGAPWHLTFAFVLQGIFSGYVPASAALISVSVPDSRLSRSLSIVTSAQYLGNTLGPMLGALMVDLPRLPRLDPRRLILPARCDRGRGALPRAARPARRRPVEHGRWRRPQTTRLEPFHPTFQLGLAILIYFVIFTMVQAIRLLSPLAMKAIDPGNVDSTIGLTFTLGGLASALSLIFLAPMFFRTGRLQRALVVSSALSGVAMLSLAFAGNVPFYITGFALFSLVQAAMIPAANTLIAGNAPRARRGTAFGLASSAQAISFMIGPFSAALFATVSIDLGFVVLAAVLFGLALVLLVALREPSMAARGSAGMNDAAIEARCAVAEQLPPHHLRHRRRCRRIQPRRQLLDPLPAALHHRGRREGRRRRHLLDRRRNRDPGRYSA